MSFASFPVVAGDHAEPGASRLRAAMLELDAAARERLAFVGQSRPPTPDLWRALWSGAINPPVSAFSLGEMFSPSVPGYGLRDPATEFRPELGSGEPNTLTTTPRQRVEAVGGVWLWPDFDEPQPHPKPFNVKPWMIMLAGEGTIWGVPTSGVLDASYGTIPEGTVAWGVGRKVQRMGGAWVTVALDTPLTRLAPTAQNWPLLRPLLTPAFLNRVRAWFAYERATWQTVSAPSVSVAQAWRVGETSTAHDSQAQAVDEAAALMEPIFFSVPGLAYYKSVRVEDPGDDYTALVRCFAPPAQRVLAGVGAAHTVAWYADVEITATKTNTPIVEPHTPADWSPHPWVPPDTQGAWELCYSESKAANEPAQFAGLNDLDVMQGLPPYPEGWNSHNQEVMVRLGALHVGDFSYV